MNIFINDADSFGRGWFLVSLSSKVKLIKDGQRCQKWLVIFGCYSALIINSLMRRHKIIRSILWENPIGLHSLSVLVYTLAIIFSISTIINWHSWSSLLKLTLLSRKSSCSECFFDIGPNWLAFFLKFISYWCYESLINLMAICDCPLSLADRNH